MDADPAVGSAVIVEALTKAVRAEESSASAHKRLDAMNGAIIRLGDEQQQTRQTMADGFAQIRSELSTSREQRAFSAGRMALLGAISLIVLPTVVGGVVALMLHYAFGIG